MMTQYILMLNSKGGKGKMAVERRLFIATTAEEFNEVKRICAYVNDFDGGQIWCDTYSKNLWYLDPNELNDGEVEKI